MSDRLRPNDYNSQPQNPDFMPRRRFIREAWKWGVGVPAAIGGAIGFYSWALPKIGTALGSIQLPQGTNSVESGGNPDWLNNFSEVSTEVNTPDWKLTVPFPANSILVLLESNDIYSELTPNNIFVSDPGRTSSYDSFTTDYPIVSEVNPAQITVRIYKPDMPLTSALTALESNLEQEFIRKINNGDYNTSNINGGTFLEIRQERFDPSNNTSTLEYEGAIEYQNNSFIQK